VPVTGASEFEDSCVEFQSGSGFWRPDVLEQVPKPKRVKVGNDPQEAHPGFDSELEGVHAECDGGGPVLGTRYAGRQEFTGTLTGQYVDHGDPPWRWYLMTDLTRKPDNYPESIVWCESDSLFVVGDPNRLLGPVAEKNKVINTAARKATRAAAKTAARTETKAAEKK
jgi:hypothetical protein